MNTKQLYRTDRYTSPETDSIATTIISKPFDGKKLGLEFHSASEAGIRVQVEGLEAVKVGVVRLGFYDQQATEVLAALTAFVAVTKEKI